jgi:hypothetical protein
MVGAMLFGSIWQGFKKESYCKKARPDEWQQYEFRE